MAEPKLAPDGLAPAAVIMLLKHLLQEQFARYRVDELAGSDIVYSTLPPDKAETGGVDRLQLNVYFYHVSQATGMANSALKAAIRSDDDNSKISPIAAPRPTDLGVDLDLMISVLGPRDLHAELVLGFVMKVFRENPVIDKDLITKILSQAGPSGAGGAITLPAKALDELAHSLSGMQVVPQFLTLDEMSKVWAMFQTQYRPSLTYRVTGIRVQG